VGDLANLTIWDDPAIRGALSWYLDVAENRRPAKFRIAATVPKQLDPPASSEDALWVELDRLTPILLHELQGPAESLRIELLLSFENEGFRVTHVYNRRGPCAMSLSSCARRAA
jgi:hypothetical protein